MIAIRLRAFTTNLCFYSFFFILVVLDCFCPCERTKNLLIIESEAQLKAKIDMIREDLAVNKPLLSSSIRRKISVSDSRPSSIVIGSTLGVSLLVLVLVLIFVSDFHHLVTDIRHGLKNIRRAYVFLKRHMWNVQNRTIFASQDFSGPSRSPEHISGEQFWPKTPGFCGEEWTEIPLYDYTSFNSFVFFCNNFYNALFLTLLSECMNKRDAAMYM